MNQRFSGGKMLRFTLVILFIVSSDAFAQTTSTAILGTVLDSSGASIADAQITITNAGTGQSRKTTTNESGYYNVPALDPGTYNIAVQKPGFRQQIRSSVGLQVNQKLTLDFSLGVGDVNETVLVQAEAPVVDTASASLGTVVSEQKIVDLPLNGRNYAQLAYMIPGVTPGQRHSNDTVNFSNPYQISANGQGSSTRSSHWTVSA